MNNPNHISQEEFDRIEQFILGNMYTEEADAFKEELRQNPTLREKYSEVEALINAVEEGALRSSLKEFHEEMEFRAAATKGTNKLPSWYWAAAAAIVLLIAAAVWVLFPLEPNHQRLFAQYYQEDPGLITAMSAAGKYDFDRAMVEYKSGNYKDAILRWEKQLLEKPENDTLNYFLGSAHLALKETDVAIKYFESVTKMPESRFSEDNFWYLALAYLRQGSLEKAQHNLNKSNHPLREQLLKSLQEK